MIARMRQPVVTAMSMLILAGALAAAQAKKDTLDGVRNFTVVDATVGCAGATETRAFPALKERGYVAVVNLRLPTEVGAAIDESRAAAGGAGLKFIHLPFNAASPDPSVVDAFLKAVTDPANQPVFINCGSANRVSALWLIKRMLVDKWDEAKAVEEARVIGLSNEALQKFALEYVAARRKQEVHHD
jgi:uncharacterized protein (TIGR01244 family)